MLAVAQEGPGEREHEAREGLCDTPWELSKRPWSWGTTVILAVSMAICLGPKMLQGRKKGLGGRQLKGWGKEYTATLRRGHPLDPAMPPPCRASQAQAGSASHPAPKVSWVGFHRQAFQVWGPHREHPARGQASKFPSRASCRNFGPSQLASAAARQG